MAVVAFGYQHNAVFFFGYLADDGYGAFVAKFGFVFGFNGKKEFVIFAAV
jgi:hypothetical protein